MPALPPEDASPQRNGSEPPPEQTSLPVVPGVILTPDGIVLPALPFRAQDLYVGALWDVSDEARQAGFQQHPVALTHALWKDIQAIPAAYSHEQVSGRLWDVLTLGAQALRQLPQPQAEFRYNVVLHLQDRSLYTVKCLLDPGEDGLPAWTLSNPEQDKRFALGQVLLTPGAVEALVAARCTPEPYLSYHRVGDWGELDPEDQAVNDRALNEGTRLLSAYTLPHTGDRLWVITEWHRSLTTVLVPAEY